MSTRVLITQKVFIGQIFQVKFRCILVHIRSHQFNFRSLLLLFHIPYFDHCAVQRRSASCCFFCEKFALSLLMLVSDRVAGFAWRDVRASDMHTLKVGAWSSQAGAQAAIVGMQLHSNYPSNPRNTAPTRQTLLKSRSIESQVRRLVLLPLRQS